MAATTARPQLSPIDALETALDHDASSRISRRDVPAALLVRSTLGQLLRMAIEEWSMIAGLCILAVVTPGWAYLVLFIPLAGRYHALGVILHDAAHMNARSASTGHRLLELLCGLPIATTVSAMRYHHLRHHRDSGMGTDPYFKEGPQTVLWWTVHSLRGALLFPFWSVRGLVGSAASLLPPLRNVYARVFLQDRSGGDLRNSTEVIGCARDEWFQVAFQLAVIPAFILWPRAFLLFYIVPVTVAYVISSHRLLIEHHYESVGDRRAETIIATTRDNQLGWLGALVLAPRNVGYHVVHHLHPQVSLTALPHLRSWYRSRHPDVYP